MSYDESDAARDEFIEEIGRELYPDHKIQAIEEFTADRLRSFYVAHPDVMRPAVDSLQEGKALRALGKHSAALVFFVTAIELLLKATLLKHRGVRPGAPRRSGRCRRAPRLGSGGL